MTVIRFRQRPPEQGPTFRSPRDAVQITRSQRTNGTNGDVLLPGLLILPLVDGMCEGEIEDTKPGESVAVTYGHRDPYTRTVEIPYSLDVIEDTDLIDVELRQKRLM